jgi:hypothetical protein
MQKALLRLSWAPAKLTSEQQAPYSASLLPTPPDSASKFGSTGSVSLALSAAGYIAGIPCNQNSKQSKFFKLQKSNVTITTTTKSPSFDLLELGIPFCIVKF